MAPSRSRRRTLQLTGAALGALVAGCASLPSFGSTPTSTPACGSTATLPSPTPQPDGAVSPLPYPSKPASLSRSSASEYALEYEEAYLVNTWLENTDRLYRLDLSIGNTTARERGRGFVIRYDVQASLAYQNPEPTATPPSTIDGDEAYRANYFVSDRIVMRVESRTDETPDPLESGEILQCAD